MVPVIVDGEQVKLAVITYKPAGDGPFPTLVLHHGSTGRGDNPSLFAHPTIRSQGTCRLVHGARLGGCCRRDAVAADRKAQERGLFAKAN